MCFICDYIQNETVNLNGAKQLIVIHYQTIGPKHAEELKKMIKELEGLKKELDSKMEPETSEKTLTSDEFWSDLEEILHVMPSAFG
jgi:hypothetical protein